ncbi:MAG: hypothetical protein HYZ16_09410 [Bacteroidetes bacterium]|jgi:hypothetical protein|nr:hypothetical protein [Bacteroidota bacterium]
MPLGLILLFRTGETHLLKLPVLAGDTATKMLRENAGFPAQLAQANFLLYLSESVDNQLQTSAKEQLLELANRLEKAHNHPTSSVNDIYILSVSNQAPVDDDRKAWLHWQVETPVHSIAAQLGSGHGRTEQPVEDHLCYLIDKNGQVRGIYFSAHGKFIRDVLGELTVLNNEFHP